MKKYMIRCDLEGASGVIGYDQARPGKPEYETYRQYFMSDLMAVIHSLNECGADEIYIYDEHIQGRNVVLSMLPENVSAFFGKPPYTSAWAGGLDETFDGMIMVGFHSKAGTQGALLNHSYEDDIADMRINGISVGEIGMETAIAGECGVPLIMVTADSEGVNEALALVPDAVCVSVKQSCGEYGALCYPLSKTEGLIKEATKKAIERAPEIQPYKIAQPIKLVVTLKEGAFLESMRKKYAAFIDDNQVTITKDTLLGAYAAYWDMKISCQEA